MLILSRNYWNILLTASRSTFSEKFWWLWVEIDEIFCKSYQVVYSEIILQYIHIVYGDWVYKLWSVGFWKWQLGYPFLLNLASYDPMTKVSASNNPGKSSGRSWKYDMKVALFENVDAKCFSGSSVCRSYYVAKNWDENKNNISFSLFMPSITEKFSLILSKKSTKFKNS